VKLASRLVDDGLSALLQLLTDRQRQAIYEALNGWIVTAKKRPLSPDVLERLTEDARQRALLLSRSIEIVIQEGSLVLRASPDDDRTLQVFLRGSTWMEPCPHLVKLVVESLK
jgi:hypothetical protein